MKWPSFPINKPSMRDGKEMVSPFKSSWVIASGLVKSKGHILLLNYEMSGGREYHGEQSVMGRWAIWHHFHPILCCENCLCSAVCSAAYGWTGIGMARGQLLYFATVPPFYHPVKLHRVSLLSISLTYSVPLAATILYKEIVLQP